MSSGQCRPFCIGLNVHGEKWNDTTAGKDLLLGQYYCHRISTALPLVNTLESRGLPDTPYGFLSGEYR